MNPPLGVSYWWCSCTQEGKGTQNGVHAASRALGSLQVGVVQYLCPALSTAVPWEGTAGSPNRRDSPVLGYSCVMAVPSTGVGGFAGVVHHGNVKQWHQGTVAMLSSVRRSFLVLLG